MQGNNQKGEEKMNLIDGIYYFENGLDEAANKLSASVNMAHIVFVNLYTATDGGPCTSFLKAFVPNDADRKSPKIVVHNISYPENHQTKSGPLRYEVGVEIVMQSECTHCFHAMYIGHRKGSVEFIGPYKYDLKPSDISVLKNCYSLVGDDYDVLKTEES
jgi:hypothetical protein